MTASVNYKRLTWTSWGNLKCTSTRRNPSSLWSINTTSLSCPSLIDLFNRKRLASGPWFLSTLQVTTGGTFRRRIVISMVRLPRFLQLLTQMPTSKSMAKMLEAISGRWTSKARVSFLTWQVRFSTKNTTLNLKLMCSALGCTNKTRQWASLTRATLEWNKRTCSTMRTLCLWVAAWRLMISLKMELVLTERKKPILRRTTTWFSLGSEMIINADKSESLLLHILFPLKINAKILNNKTLRN